MNKVVALPKATKRPLTPEERERSLHVRSVWLARKAELKLSQKIAARELGVTQPTFSQYMTQVIPLNTDFVVSLANLLKLAPEELDPTLKHTLRKNDKTFSETVAVPILGTVSGASRGFGESNVLNVAAEKKTQENWFAVEVDTDEYAPSLMKGSYAIINPLELLKPNDYVVVRRRGEENYTPYQLLSITEADVIVQRVTNTVEGKHVSTDFREVAIRIPHHEVALIGKVKQIVFP